MDNPAARFFSVLIFRLGTKRFAFETQDIIEVVSHRPVHTIPFVSDPLIQGLISVQGQLRICISLSKLFSDSFEDNVSASTATKCLVIQKSEFSFAFFVDEVESVIASAYVIPYIINPEQTIPDYFIGDIQDDFGKVGLLDPLLIGSKIQRCFL